MTGSAAADGALIVAMLAMARMLPVVLLVPYLGGRWVPWPVKLGLAAALVLFLSPSLSPTAPAEALALPTGLLLGLAVKEALLGLAIGVLAALFFFAAEMAGALIDAARGQTAATMLSPGLSDRDSPVSALVVLLVIVVYLTVGGHRLLVRSLAESFAIVPVLGVPPGDLSPSGLLQSFIQVSAQLFLVAAAISLPVLASVFLVDLALGVLSRIAPEAHGFFLGLPVKATLGLLVLLFSLSAVVGLLVGELQTADRWIRELLNAFGGG